MKGSFKRKAAAVSAAAIALSTLGIMPVSAASDVILRIEGEDLTGATLWTSIYENQLPGYSGEGFAYLTNDALSFEVDVPENAMYSIVIHGAQILSPEGRLQTVTVNGTEYSKTMPYSDKWTDFDFGMVRLDKGKNELSFINKYGYMAIDYVTVSPSVFPDLSGATEETCDPDATPETKALMAYLKSVYGKNILSGQQQIYGGGNTVDTTIRYDKEKDACLDSDGNNYPIDRDSKDEDEQGNVFYWHCSDEKTGQVYTYSTQNRNYTYNNYNNDINLIYNMTGKYPAIQGFDFGSYCPCFAWDDGVAQRMIEWTNEKGGICTASWHVNVPKVMADYTVGEPMDFSATTYKPKETDFMPSKCLVKGTKEYEYFKLCMKNLAAELLKLQEAGVPVIFRPFHEAEGNGGKNGEGSWFWWSKEGADVCNQLWTLLQDTLQNEYGLHNLIWEQNLYTWSSDSALWYAGDDKVDIVAFDKYNVNYNRHDGNPAGSGPNFDAETGIFYMINDFVDGKKMVAMAENDTTPSLENMEIEHAYWLYFCPWYDTPGDPFVTGEKYQDSAELKKLYNSDFCITLDELPADLFKSGAPAASQTEPAQTKPETGTPAAAKRGDVDESGIVDISDAVLLAQYSIGVDNIIISDQGLVNGEMNNDGKLSSDDVTLIIAMILGIK